MSNFNQPICDECWASRNPNLVPVRLIDPEEVICCYCGAVTSSGIYIRVSPDAVPYPRRGSDG